MPIQTFQILTQIIHTHSMDVIGLFTLTQRHAHALNRVQGLFNSHTKAVFLMVTPRWVAFNNSSMAFTPCSMAFTHAQWVFTLTQWHSCALNGVQKLFTLTHWHSCTLNGCYGAIHTHSKACTCTQLYSGAVQFSHKGVLLHCHITMSRTQY
jgi:hypothetical protein